MKKEYVASICFKERSCKKSKYVRLNSKDVIGAMMEAENLFCSNDDVYIVDVLECDSIRKTIEDGITHTRTSYLGIACTRDGLCWYLDNDKSTQDQDIRLYHHLYTDKDGWVIVSEYSVYDGIDVTAIRKNAD